jgi:hypothetical protein
MPEAKFVQICVASMPDSDPEIFALDALGTVWNYYAGERGWNPLEAKRLKPYKRLPGGK